MDERQRADDVRRVVAGDAEALQRLIVHYHATLRGVVAGAIDASLRRHVDPDDVLQQAYISVFQALATTSPSRDRQGAIQHPTPDVATDPPSPDVAADPPTPDVAADAPVGRLPGRKGPGTSPPLGAGPLSHHFDGPGHLYKWLERIALNQLKDVQRALRRQKRDVARELADRPDPATSYPDLLQRLAGRDPTPSRLIARDEAIAAVMTCLARLGDDQRSVVRLRFLEDVPVAEIARRLNKSETAVYTLCHRGLKALRDLMLPLSHYLTHL